MTYVPVEPFREAYEHSGVTPSRLAECLGWVCANGRPDSQRVRRTLGLAASPINGGGSRVRASVAYETAAHLCRALNLNPVDMGI